MLATLEYYQDLWKNIKEESISPSTYKAIIFVSCFDVDAFAASAMLSMLFKKHILSFKTIPITGFQSLKNEYNRIDPSIKNIFMMGFGGTIDLESFLEIDPDDENRPNIHVFDAQKPWNLANLFQSDKILCYEDNESESFQKFREAYEYLQNFQAEEEENADLDKDDDNLSQTQQDENSDERNALKNQHLGELAQYNLQGSYQSTTVTMVIYTLLTAIGETSHKSLWLAIVGLTSIEAQNPRIYKLFLPSLLEEIKRFRQIEPSKGNSHNKEIIIYQESDFSLFLLRQWCLYESMMHSSYVSSKLFLWCEDGRKKLHKLLAKIGITLQDSKESWIHISPTLRKELKEKLDSVSEFYGIENVTRVGVIRQFGQSGVMSAGDCSESIAAILETGVRGNLEDIDLESESQIWMSNFWSAWDTFNDLEMMKVGVEKAKTIQKATVSTTNFIFENDIPKDIGGHRLIVVQDAPELQFFTNPLSLKRLAMWVFEGCSEKNPVALPMVLAVLDEKRKIYLVYGIAALRSREDVDEIQPNNHFGRIFQNIATKINAHIRVDTFDTAIIELSSEDLTRFIEALITDAN